MILTLLIAALVLAILGWGTASAADMTDVGQMAAGRWCLILAAVCVVCATAIEVAP